MDTLSITYSEIAWPKPFAHNPRSHSKKQIEAIAQSIKRNGFTNPILTDEAGEIIAGHGRLRAAKQLGLNAVPVIVLRDLTEVQKRALRIADNKLALDSEWSVDTLKLNIEAILELDENFEIDDTGFTSAEVDPILYPGNTSANEEAPIPQVPLVAVTRPGDVWKLGRHVVGCGDCGDIAFVQKVVGNRKIDAAFLDPPYNLEINGNVSSRGKHREFVTGSGELSDTEFREFLRTRLSACAEVSKAGAIHFVAMDHRHAEHLSDAGAAVYSDRLNVCVWVKSNGGMGSLYRSRHEFIFVFKVGDAKHLNNVELGRHGRNRTNVWEYDSANSLRGDTRQALKLHPTVKPVSMVRDAIMDVTRSRDHVLDGFLGSGTTLLACHQIDRICHGIELDPLYVDVAIERWCELTGQDAVEQASGETFSERKRQRQTSGGMN